MGIRYWISTKPSLWPLMIPFAWTRNRRKSRRDGAFGEESFVSASYPLVVDGFPGSANSYATKVLRNYFPEGTRFGNHFHSPAETLRCLELGVPVLLTLRHPEQAVVSFVRRWDYVEMKSALRYYQWFYEALYGSFDKMVVSDFSYTIEHMDGIVERLREDFGVALELRPDRADGGKVAPPQADPSVKLRDKKALAQEFREQIPAEEIKKAEELYRKCKEHPKTLRA